ncbi:cbb3-type cytochrome c oxidase subunit I [Verrucomicrobia bacterium]|nr:cbb3-type cytochrome c oxidase subunit I [Verrucomicrobiota bacterium]
MSSIEKKGASASAEEPEGTSLPSIEEIDSSCRTPVWMMFTSAAKWLVFALAVSLLATVNLHAEGGILSHCPIFTYGRLYPAFMNSLIYGFGVQAGLAACLWLLARVGKTKLIGGGVATVGAIFWNIAVSFGVLGILGGWTTGFELLEMPFMVSLALLASYVAIAVPALFTFKNRQPGEMYPTQYFILAALFWFPWIYTSSVSLLNCVPVHGVMQAVVAWWYGANLFLIFFGFIGLGAIFYLIPQRSGRGLYSSNYAVTAFWLLLIFAPLTGIPQGAPVPAWIPALSSGASIVLFVPIILIIMNLHLTCKGNLGQLRMDRTLKAAYVSGHLFVLSVGCVIVGPLLETINHVATFFTIFIPGNQEMVQPMMDVADTTRLSLFQSGADMLLLFGFFGVAMFSVINLAVPKMFKQEWPVLKISKHQITVAIVGVVLFCAPMIVGGFLQGYRLHDPSISFAEISAFTTKFIRIRTMGELFMLISAGMLFLNLISMFWKSCGSQCLPIAKGLLEQPTEEAK